MSPKKWPKSLTLKSKIIIIILVESRIFGSIICSETEGTNLANFAAFFNEFLGYIITLIIIIVVAAVGFIIGFFLRKSLDKKKAEAGAEGGEPEKG